jgi:predicted nucleotidyltransferase
LTDSSATDSHPFPAARLRAFAARHPIRRLAVFGSVARGRAGPTSDIDILVDFEPGAGIGLFDHARIAQELEDQIGRPVDLVTWNSLRPRMRENIARESVMVYER